MNMEFVSANKTIQPLRVTVPCSTSGMGTVRRGSSERVVLFFSAAVEYQALEEKKGPSEVWHLISVVECRRPSFRKENIMNHHFRGSLLFVVCFWSWSLH